ncbi:MAG: Hsp70 family protein [Parachlamydiaceae bacterium]
MRYIIGIDLGTTNSALCFIDTEHPSLAINLFAIPQLTGEGKIDSLHTLPSFCYLPAIGEWPAGALKLPWKDEVKSFTGQFAKIQGAKVPTRLVQSAKSWLCNVSSNRRDKILPIEAADISQRLSPVEASTRYLEHLKNAWNSVMAKGDPTLELEEQEVVLTVPASFDEIARTLTVEAAQKAGLTHLTLVEEPQAAFYSWICQHEDEWEKKFKKGDTILVCDVGGGTTDFSLIEIEEKESQLSFQRMAVGDHLLLGGDNIDAALSHYLEQKFQTEGHFHLESDQWLQLRAEARHAKECLLRSDAKPLETYAVVLQGKGSSVVKGSMSVTITREEIENILLNGFFGCYPLEEALQLRRSRGFRSMGLPYEDEPSITKHLAHFLEQSQHLKKNKGIDYVLFNGGTLKPEIFRAAIEQSLRSWFPQTPLKSLISSSLDLAVARGAAYYGKVRRGLGVLIGGGTPRNYYLKIDVKDSAGKLSTKALTLIPRGSLEGQLFESDQMFSLRPNTPVSFYLLTSHVRLHDKEGDLIDINPADMHILPPIQTVLRFGRKQVFEEGKATLPVRLTIHLTVIGTIEIWLHSQTSEHKWQLEFQVRSMADEETTPLQTGAIKQGEIFEAGHLDQAQGLITSLFEPASTVKPSQIIEKLEAEIGAKRREWGSRVLRELWTPLLKGAPYRKLSADHETRWWNLAGFFLRPGFGCSLDDFRLKELWKIILAELKTVKTHDCLIQMCICLRRVAGGLNKGQQMQLMSELIGMIVDKKTGKIEIKRKSDLYFYSEKIRTLASLERLDLTFKIRLAEALMDRILKQTPEKEEYWALGRIGARHLLYGSAGQVIPKERVEKWVEELLRHQPSEENRDAYFFLLKQLARKTDHRELNLCERLIQRLLKMFPETDLNEWLLKEKELSQVEQEQLFGDQLPSGLVLEPVQHL